MVYTIFGTLRSNLTCHSRVHVTAKFEFAYDAISFAALSSYHCDKYTKYEAHVYFLKFKSIRLS